MTDEPEKTATAEGEQGHSAAQAVEAFCRELISRLRLSLELEAREDGRVVTVNLTGADRPFLLANTAALLNSIEYLVNKAFRTGKDEEIATVVLDSDRYRRSREAELKLLARIASEKVVSHHRPLSLQPMTPRERRIVHLALAGIEGVRSQSDGEGDNRNITIYPTD